MTAGLERSGERAPNVIDLAERAGRKPAGAGGQPSVGREASLVAALATVIGKIDRMLGAHANALSALPNSPAVGQALVSCAITRQALDDALATIARFENRG